ncbi:unnamed protein product [Caenorhabditis brenneri]
MSLSRPARFPLLKLPFLCIECVIKNWDIFDIIFFALSSKKARQIVKHLKIPLNGIRIFLKYRKWIQFGFGGKIWNIERTSSQSFFREHVFVRKDALALQSYATPLYTSRTDGSLRSYTDGNEVTALKMAIEFLDEVFKCSVENVDIIDSDFPESFGVKSTETLGIRYRNSQPFVYAQNQKLSSLLKSLEVTGTCNFWVTNTETDFYCDPKLFKCRKLVFWPGSTDWVTREILLQFEVPRLKFDECCLSVEDIISFVTQWFHSDNKKLEYLYIKSCGKLSLEKFQTEDLNPVPFSGRTLVPLADFFGYIDFSQGLEIARHDGLQATIHVKERAFLFYIWHL